MKIREQLDTVKEMYGTKAFLASLLCEHAKEFKGMYVEEVKNCIKEVHVSSKKVYQSENETYDIYFTLSSPLLNYDHEIVVCVEIRLTPKLSNEKLPMEVEHTLKMHLERKIECKEKKIKSYSFWFYLDPPIEYHHTNARYAATINSIGNEYFQDETCEVFIMNLGDPVPQANHYIH